MTKNKEDPTGQARNRNKSSRRLSSRVGKAERKVKALFRAIPKSVKKITKIVNAKQTTVYDYEADQEQLTRSVEFILNEELLETQAGIMQADWFWKDDVELPYRQGTVEEIRDFNQLIIAGVIAGLLVKGIAPETISVEQVLMSEAYRSALRNTQINNFSTIKTLSERTAAQVLQRINSGIQSGQTPTFIANEISQRFDVAKSSAKRISETEINKAFNNAKLDATRLLGERTGLRAAVIHISALLPTTRPHHADRHGNAYTVADQQQWWDSGTERINCKCSTQSVLIDNSGKVVQAELQQDIKQEGKEFFNG